MSATATALLTFSGSLVAGLFQAMDENGFWMSVGPAVGQHLIQPVVIGMHAHEKFANVGPRLQPMTFGAGENCVQHGRTRTGRFAP